MSGPAATVRDVARSLAWVLAVVGVWFALQRWVLPALGCRT
jgi:hypothetical protein